MEALAYIHCCAAYDEAVGIENDFPEWEFNWKLPSSAWISLLATVAALSILGTTSGAFAVGSGRYYVASSGLNVRSSPGGDVVKTLGYGQAVDLTGYTSGGWAQTVPGNWVYASYLTGGYHHGHHHGHHHGYGGRYVLGPGSQGRAVRAVQRALQNQGYSVSVDGYYGGNTSYAVQRFQQNKGLYADGLVGPRTRSVLF